MKQVLTFEEYESRNRNIPQTSVLLWGPPKTGKTRSTATLLPRGPVHIHDFDLGADPAVRVAKVTAKEPTDLLIYRYRQQGGDRIGTTQARPRPKDVFMEVLKTLNEYYGMLDQSTGWWKTGVNAPAAIVLDSVTVLQELILDFVLCLEGHNLGDPKTDARRDFGMQMGKLVEVVESLKALPCISVFICHEKILQDGLTDEVRVDPLVTGQLSGRFAQLFGIVLFSVTSPDGKGGTKYEWITRPQGRVKTAGTRHRDDLPVRIPQDFSLVL